MSSGSHAHIPVLAYHRVLPQRAPNAITIDEFEWQLRWLYSHGFQTLSSKEFERTIKGERVAERAVVITFDDGYLDNWYLAVPLLEKYRMTALLFLITDKLPERKKRSLGSWAEEADERYLSWEEVAWIAATGTFEVHSHTASHARFWQQERSPEDIKRAVCQDLAASVRTLRSHGYQHDLHLAWPWGYFRNNWLDEVWKMGFRACYTMRPGTNFPDCDLGTVRRLGPRHIAALLRLPTSIVGSRSFGMILNRACDSWGFIRGRP